ncbi:MAG: ABC transporter [Proteobacteria bacterium HN_bin10]|nr:MAG: ABC transporter [Proteobacteria bacterium HN_bin10]
MSGAFSNWYLCSCLWWRRLGVMTIKELLQVSRDGALVFFFIWSFNANVFLSANDMKLQLTNARLVVHDADHSMASRELIHRFHAPFFRFDGEIARPDVGLRLLDEGRAMLVLDIPPRFQEALAEGEQIAVQLQVDTTNSPQGLSAAGYAARIVGEFGLEVAAQRLGFAGEAEDGLPVIRSEHRAWYNPNQTEAWFQSVVELLNMITVFAILLSAAAMVREKERGTIEQLLVSPLTPFQIMFPKVAAMTLTILMGTAVSLFAIVQGVFHLPVKGNLALFFSMTALYVFTTSGLGLFISTFTTNQAQVGLMTILVVAPMLLLSGTWTPPEAMPEWVRYLMLLSPLHYFIDISYGILLKGVGLEILWKPALAMVALGGSLFGFGMWRFRRQFR